MTGHIRSTVRVALLVIATIWSAAAGAQTVGSGNPDARETTARCQLDDGEDRTVTRVLDGETLLLDGGSEARLVGALAPRAFDAAGDTADWPLADRARAALEALVAGRSVRLAFAGRRSDRYGRLLAHVFVARSNGETERVWVQGEMLRQGHARAYSLEGSAHCLAELIGHEAVAREAAAGMWAEAAYAVRAADDVRTLLRLAGTFQIVEGRVLRVSEVRGTTYLNFGEDQRQDFTVSVRAPARRTMTASVLTPEQLAGRQIRVRGWIERRGGPLVDLHHPDALEVLSAAEPELVPPEVRKPDAPSRRRPRLPATER